MEKKENNFGWGVLGFFVPIVGLILFIVWLKKKNSAAKAAGLGALIGAILEVVGFVVLLICIPGIFGLVYTTNYVPSTEIEEQIKVPTNEKKDTKKSINTDGRTNECTGTAKVSAATYAYEVKLTDEQISECKNVTVKLNDDFTMKLELNKEEQLLKIYINDNYITDEFIGSDIVYGGNIVGNTFITREFSTSVGAHPILVNKDGVKYNYTDPETSSYGDERLVMDDGMTVSVVKVDEAGALLISGIRYSEQRGFYFPSGYKMDYQTMCDDGYEKTLQTYNLTDDYPYAVTYKYVQNAQGEYEMNYSERTVDRTFKDYYSETCKTN